MRKFTMMSVMLATVVMLFGQIATAQEEGQQRTRGQRGAGQQGQQDRGQRGPQGGQQRGGRGISMIALASIEAVQSEIDMLDDQVKELAALQEKLRGDRGTQTRRGQGGNSEDLSEEEIQKQREERRTQATDQAAEFAKKADEGLKDVLLDQQYARLREIYVQALGAAALQDETVAKELKITEKQKTAMQEASTKAREAAMEEFTKLRESGDREAMQEKFAEMRKESEAKVFGVLSAKQKSRFEKMKGEAFEMPAAARGGQRGRGQRGGGDQPQRGGQRGGDQSNDGGDRL
ncbi:MAG: hypothetical protein ACI87E_002194 [Mariniblastus sp.]|jgi:hypothetical protein